METRLQYAHFGPRQIGPVPRFLMEIWASGTKIWSDLGHHSWFRSNNWMPRLEFADAMRQNWRNFQKFVALWNAPRNSSCAGNCACALKFKNAQLFERNTSFFSKILEKNYKKSLKFRIFWHFSCAQTCDFTCAEHVLKLRQIECAERKIQLRNAVAHAPKFGMRSPHCKRFM